MTMTGTVWVITSAGIKSVGIFSLLMPHEKGNDKNRKIWPSLEKNLFLKMSEMRVQQRITMILVMRKFISLDRLAS